MSGRRRFGNVRRLPSGRWQASYVGPDRRRHSAPSTFSTRADAGRWLALVESDILRGIWFQRRTGPVTVGEWAEQWFRAHEGNLKRTTASGYRSLLRLSIFPCSGTGFFETCARWM